MTKCYCCGCYCSQRSCKFPPKKKKRSKTMATCRIPSNCGKLLAISKTVAAEYPGSTLGIFPYPRTDPIAGRRGKKDKKKTSWIYKLGSFWSSLEPLPRGSFISPGNNQQKGQQLAREKNKKVAFSSGVGPGKAGVILAQSTVT